MAIAVRTLHLQAMQAWFDARQQNKPEKLAHDAYIAFCAKHGIPETSDPEIGLRELMTLEEELACLKAIAISEQKPGTIA
jgi:hypothetical protein